jgi:hypothetical protein
MMQFLSLSLSLSFLFFPLSLSLLSLVCLWRWAVSCCLGGSVPPSHLLLLLHELWKSIPPSELHKEFLFLIFLENFFCSQADSQVNI